MSFMSFILLEMGLTDFFAKGKTYNFMFLHCHVLKQAKSIVTFIIYCYAHENI